MSVNGKYSVWYHSPRGESAGTLRLENGSISGEGTALSYSGSYVIDGDHFTARIKTWLRTEDRPSVLGVDEVEIVVTGKAPDGTVASCKGHAVHAPDLSFDVTLVRMSD